MNKPIEVIRQEFIDGMIGFITNSGLPSFMIADVMKRILTAVEANIDKDYEKANAEYLRAVQLEAQREQEEEKNKEEEKKGGAPNRNQTDTNKKGD